jgi:hypothetical protein
VLDSAYLCLDAPPNNHAWELTKLDNTYNNFGIALAYAQSKLHGAAKGVVAIAHFDVAEIGLVWFGISYTVSAANPQLTNVRHWLVPHTGSCPTNNMLTTTKMRLL